MLKSFTLRSRPLLRFAAVIAALFILTLRAEAQTAISPTFSITASVADNRGNPVTDAKFGIQSIDFNRPTLIADETTDHSGKLTFVDVPPGTYYLNVGRDWLVDSPATFVVSANSTVNFVIEKQPNADLTGSVVDSSGKPVAGAEIVFALTHSLWPSSSQSESAVVDSGTDGTYTVVDAPSHLYDVLRSSVKCRGYVYVSGGDLSMTNGKLTISPIVMAQLGAQVQGVIVNGLGKPVARAWVGCPQDGDDFRPVQTDATGHFTITNLIEGPVDIYAAKGRYFGHVVVQASSSTTLTALTIKFGPLPPPIPAGDITRAVQMISELANNIPASLKDQSDWFHDKCAAAIAMSSPSAALRFLGSYGELTGMDIDAVEKTAAIVDPVSTATWATPLLARQDDGYWTGNCATDLGLKVAPFNKAVALSLYKIALRKIPLTNLSQDASPDVMALDALANALNQPEADDIYQKITSAITAQKMQAPTESTGPGIAEYQYTQLVQQLAIGDMPKALALLPEIEPQDYANLLTSMIKSSIKKNPQGALDVYNYAGTIKTVNNGLEAYNQCLCLVLPLIYKTNPHEALALAQTLELDQAEAITIVADQTPLTQAKQLYNAAMALCTVNWPTTTPESIAAHGMLRNRQLGVELYQKAFQIVIGDETNNMHSMPNFAFYYSRIDPAYSRVLLENLFYKDQNNPSQFTTSQNLKLDAGAMAAIDPVRADEMAQAITDPSDRMDARLKVAEYVLFNQTTRDTLPIGEWLEDYSWSPGVPSTW